MVFPPEEPECHKNNVLYLKCSLVVPSAQRSVCLTSDQIETYRKLAT